MKEMTGAEYNAMVERSMSEATWGTHLVGAARGFGFLVTHFRPARTSDGGWTTAIEGDAGYPDLTCTNGARVLIVEAKKQDGALRASQHRWLTLLSGVPGVEVDIWRPADREYVHRVFAGAPIDAAHFAREMAKPTVPDRLRTRGRKRGGIKR